MSANDGTSVPGVVSGPVVDPDAPHAVTYYVSKGQQIFVRVTGKVMALASAAVIAALGWPNRAWLIFAGLIVLVELLKLLRRPKGESVRYGWEALNEWARSLPQPDPEKTTVYGVDDNRRIYTPRMAIVEGLLLVFAAFCAWATKDSGAIWVAMPLLAIVYAITKGVQIFIVFARSTRVFFSLDKLHTWVDTKGR